MLTVCFQLLFSFNVYTFELYTVAVVGLEEMMYSVSESDGAVELCAVVYIPYESFDCPIAFWFSVSLSTSDNSAGTYTAEVVVN